MKTHWRMAVVAAGLVLGIGLAYAVKSPDYRRAKALVEDAHHPLRHEAVTSAATSEQAVIVRVPLGERGVGTLEEHAAIDALANTLKIALSGSGAGGFDGKECGRGVCLLLMYGTDANKVFGSVEPILRASPVLKGRDVFIRRGRSDDLHAELLRVAL